MTAILGISAYYHDSAAALVVDGRIVAAAQEERFTRIKHDAAFPTQAVAACLAQAGLTAKDLDYVAFYDKPLVKFDRLLETYFGYAPAGFLAFVRAMPVWLRQKLHLRRELDRGLGGAYRRPYLFAEHHESHAASAFFPSPFEEAVVLTIDGVGEWATASIAHGRGNRLTMQAEMRFPHSLGLLYSAFTYYTGFKVNSGEYKLMGLAPYGKPVYADRIRERLLDLKEDGSFRLDLSYFDYCHGSRMTNARFHDLFGGPPRAPEAEITERHLDVAASIQVVTEEVMVRMVRHACQRTGVTDLCLAGGVALNCVGNGRLVREGVCRRIWVQPAAGDAGGALGVALLVWHQLLDHPRRALEHGDHQQGSLLGPESSRAEIKAALDAAGARYHELAGEGELVARVAELLAERKIVGWHQGRMEFGPRALGGRSILADPRQPEMQRDLNLKIKFRESFRPFAPAVLAEATRTWFDLPEGVESPYMLLVAPVVDAKRLPVADDGRRGLASLGALRSQIPAVTHVDYSARVQTVDRVRNPRFHALLEAFAARTGCPVLVNTSFNVRGEPIVCTPADSYRTFMATHIDALAIGDFVLIKDEQPAASEAMAAEHLARFAPD